MAQKFADIDPTYKDVIEFWHYVRKGPGCWEWFGPRNRKEYGRATAGGRTVGAHRMSWRIHRGVIPDGLIVCHRCDNPPCVRPDHLFLGTHKDNIQDAITKGRFPPRQEAVHRTQDTSIVAMVRSGMTHAKVGHAFGMTADQVRRVLERSRDKSRHT